MFLPGMQDVLGSINYHCVVYFAKYDLKVNDNVMKPERLES